MATQRPQMMTISTSNERLSSLSTSRHQASKYKNPHLHPPSVETDDESSIDTTDHNDDATAGTSQQRFSCDACQQCCPDTPCGDDVVETCAVDCCRDDATIKFSSTTSQRCYTMCQVRRHNTTASAWLVVGNKVYDATSILQNHPGGINSIVRKSGGVVDCTTDFDFHTKKTQRMWQQKYCIGTCYEEISSSAKYEKRWWWMFWK